MRCILECFYDDELCPAPTGCIFRRYILMQPGVNRRSEQNGDGVSEEYARQLEEEREACKWFVAFPVTTIVRWLKNLFRRKTR